METMTKYTCAICGEESETVDKAFDHLVDHHGDKLMSEYIIED